MITAKRASLPERQKTPSESAMSPTKPDAIEEPRAIPHQDTLLKTLSRYRRAYQNWPSVTIRILLKRFPLRATLRNGRIVELKDHSQAYHCSQYETLGWSFDPDNDSVLIPRDLPLEPLRFTGAGHNGTLPEVFRDGVYDFLEVNGRTVVDIGASIGDTAVYFALKGATKVIALEPFPTICSWAEENVARNGLSSTVTIMHAACQAKDGSLRIDGGARATVGLSARESPGSEVVEALSLQSLVKRFEISMGVLKLDCEGDEYGIMASSDDETLHAFDQIMIEYHNGVQHLVERLQSAGYWVRYTKPWRKWNPSSKRYIDFGLIKASSSLQQGIPCPMDGEKHEI